MVKISHLNAVGSIICSMMCIRPNLAYGTNKFVILWPIQDMKIERFFKFVFRYLNGTTNFGLSIKKQAQVDEDKKLIGFVDASFC